MQAPRNPRKMRTCPRSCTQHRTRSGRLAERRTFDGTRCSNCGFAPGGDGDMGVRFEKASDM